MDRDRRDNQPASPWRSEALTASGGPADWPSVRERAAAHRGLSQVRATLAAARPPAGKQLRREQEQERRTG